MDSTLDHTYCQTGTVFPFDVQLWEVLIFRVNLTKRRLQYPMIGVGEGSGGEFEEKVLRNE